MSYYQGVGWDSEVGDAGCKREYDRNQKGYACLR